METATLPRTSVALAAVLFGTSGTIATLAPMGTPALTLGTWRVAIGAIGLLAIARVKPADVSALRRHTTWVIVGGGCVAAAQLSFFESLQRIGVATGTTITIATGPVAAAFIAFTFERQRPTPRWMCGTAVAGSGIFALVGAAAGDPVGILFAVVSGSTYPMYGYAAKRLMSTVSSSVAIAGVFTVGGVVLLLASPRSLTAVRSPGEAAVALAIGVVTVSIAYPLWARGLRSLDVGTVALITLVEPTTAALLGVALVGEPLTPGLAIGSVLVVVGIGVSSSPNVPRSAAHRHDLRSHQHVTITSSARFSRRPRPADRCVRGD